MDAIDKQDKVSESSQRLAKAQRIKAKQPDSEKQTDTQRIEEAAEPRCGESRQPHGDTAFVVSV